MSAKSTRFLFLLYFFLLLIAFLPLPFSSARDSTKSRDKKRASYRNHCWRELGLGMIANDPSVNMAEQMAFSCHSKRLLSYCLRSCWAQVQFCLSEGHFRCANASEKAALLF
jgi:hypothetical protein